LKRSDKKQRADNKGMRLNGAKISIQRVKDFQTKGFSHNFYRRLSSAILPDITVMNKINIKNRDN
jgi:hypothetical protein